MRSESRRNGLTCCGWCAARHASINPSYLTEGYKSTGNNQTTGKNPKVHKGFSPYLACVNKAPKVDIRFFRQEGFSLNEETWVRDIKEKREVYGISQQKLALAAGITRPYLSDIETGKAHPSEALQEAITEALERFNPDNPLEMLFDYVRIRNLTGKKGAFMNFGQNLYNWFLSNAQSLVLLAIVVIGLYLGFKREFSKLIGFLVVSLVAVGLVFNADGVKDILLELFNKIIGA